MFLKACHDCLQQRQERHQEEDRKSEDRLRQECEAKGERYFSNVHEWRAAIARDYDAFFQKMLGVAKLTDRHYRDIKIALQKILNEPSTDSESPKYQPLFSNLPSGLLQKSPHFAIASQAASAITSPAVSLFLAAGRF